MALTLGFLHVCRGLEVAQVHLDVLAARIQRREIVLADWGVIEQRGDPHRRPGRMCQRREQCWNNNNNFSNHGILDRAGRAGLPGQRLWLGLAGMCGSIKQPLSGPATSPFGQQ